MVQRPIVNSGEKYIFGLELSRPTTSTVLIASGGARDSSNTVDIQSSNEITVNILNVGVNGIDKDEVVANTMYSLYIIGDSSRKNPPAGIFSTDFNSPQFPLGYDVCRRVGAILTLPSKEIFRFSQFGSSRERYIYYQLGVSVLTGGNSTSFVEVDMSGAIPPVKCMAICSISYTPAVATNYAILRPFDPIPPGLAIGVQFGFGVQAVQVSTQLAPVGLDGTTPKIEYSTYSGDNLDIGIFGYIDQL